MPVIGLTGAMAAGKSTAAEIIIELGHTVYDMDSIAKDLMVNDEDVKAAIVREFGKEAYFENGELNKKYLAETVFEKNPERLEKLNSIVHPAVIEDMIVFLKEWEEEAAKTGEKMVFVESALFFEALSPEGFDYTLLIDAPEETRIRRAVERSGMSRDQVKARMKRQMSSEEKRRLADFTVENAGSLEEFEKSVKFIVELLEELPPTV